MVVVYFNASNIVFSGSNSLSLRALIGPSILYFTFVPTGTLGPLAAGIASYLREQRRSGVVEAIRKEARRCKREVLPPVVLAYSVSPYMKGGREKG